MEEIKPAAPRHFKAKDAAILSVFCGFLEYAVGAGYHLIVETNPYTPYRGLLRYISVSLVVILSISGIALGCFALRRLKTLGEKRGRMWAVCGLAINGSLTGILAIAAVMLLITPPLPPLTQSVAPIRPREMRLSDMLQPTKQLLRTFERARNEKTNGLSQIAGPAIEFLNTEQLILSNYYVAIKPLQTNSVLNMAKVDGRNDFDKRLLLISNFMEASHQFSNYYGNFDQSFKTMGLKGGLSNSVMLEQIKQFHVNYPQLTLLPAMSEANERWAQGELRALNLLKTNWDQWVYDNGIQKIVPKNDEFGDEYDKIVREINAAYKDQRRIAQAIKDAQLMPQVVKPTRNRKNFTNQAPADN